MNGSEKQIKWANEIKAEINMQQLIGNGRDEKSNVLISKVVEFVENIEDANFWIDYRNQSAVGIASQLMGRGLQIKGNNYKTRIKMTMDGEFVNNDLSL